MIAGNRTMAALLTPPAPGAIAVIGVAGPAVDAILSELLRHTNGRPVQQLSNDRPTFCRLVEGPDVVDDVVVVRRTRRGQIVAEINTHGGVRIAQRTLGLVARCGGTIVQGLDFHREASCEKPVELDVDEALLTATSRRLTQWLLAQRRILPAYLDRLASRTLADAAAFRERSDVAIRLVAGLRLALIGPPNAGKSTLANRLIGTDRVITSERPGTTRDWVSETALIDGWPVRLTDTAGIRATRCPIEAEAIRRSSVQAREADVVVIVLDATATTDERQACFNEAVRLIPPEQPRIAILNKCDLAKTAVAPSPLDSYPASAPEQRSQANLVPARLMSHPAPPTPLLLLSARTGEGVRTLEEHLAMMLHLDLLDAALPTAFRPEQVKLLEAH